MKFLCFGSLNIDHTYKVPRMVVEGETLNSLSYTFNVGGKGLNQSIALARAGASVYHAGMIGPDGSELMKTLQAAGINTSYIETGDAPTGHAIIQVDQQGRNCILLHGGANQCITHAFIHRVLQHFGQDDVLVLQNETSCLAELIREGNSLGMKVVLNPSPISPALFGAPLEYVDLFIMNEIEGNALCGETEPSNILNTMKKKYPRSQSVLTLGSKGACFGGNENLFIPAAPAAAIDTTAAGDTFTGYFLHHWINGETIEASLKIAAAAAAIAVSRIGAAASIPFAQEVATRYGAKANKG